MEIITNSLSPGHSPSASFAVYTPNKITQFPIALSQNYISHYYSRFGRRGGPYFVDGRNNGWNLLSVSIQIYRVPRTGSVKYQLGVKINVLRKIYELSVVVSFWCLTTWYNDVVLDYSLVRHNKKIWNQPDVIYIFRVITLVLSKKKNR